MDHKNFDDKMEQLAKCWGCSADSVGDMKILVIPFRGKHYTVCFSALDEDFGLIVTQALEDVTSLKSEALCEVLKGNSMLNSFFSSFFIHENKQVSDALPLMYQAVFPYTQFTIPETVEYVETYLEKFANSLEALHNAMNKTSPAKATATPGKAASTTGTARASRQFTGLKI